MSSSISSPRNRRLNRRRTKRGRVMSKRIFGLLAGMIWSSYALAQVPVIDAANLTQAQQTAANTKQILATDQPSCQRPKDLTGGDGRPFLAGARLARANGAWRRLLHGTGPFARFRHLRRPAFLRRTGWKFSKHHFDADQRPSTRQKLKPPNHQPCPPTPPLPTRPTRPQRSSASSIRHREP